MNWRAAKEHWITVLQNEEDEREIESWFFLYLERAMGMSRRDYLMQMNDHLSDDEVHSFQKVIGRLSDHEPIQYILGSAYFHGEWYEVNQDVLIPRPETEDLVEIMIQELEKGTSVLDMGTGSGCIPIALKKGRPDLHVQALDISEPALRTAERNSQKQGVDVRFHQFSIEDTLPTHMHAEVVVSNPPYIPLLERGELAKRVSENEPAVALFVPDEDPLKFYRLILDRAFEMDKAKYIYWEIHSPLREHLEALCRTRGVSSFEVRRDRFGRERMMIIEK